MFVRMAAASLAALCFSYGAALAAPVSADFRGEFDLPSFSSGPRTLESLGEPVAGAPDLDLADEISNPQGFSGFASMDLDVARIITLTGDQSEAGFADYELAVFTISNIVFDAGEVVTGISQLTTGVLDPDQQWAQPTPTLAFTASGVTITYDDGGSSFQFLDGGVSTFLVETSAAEVPLPAGGALLLGALGGLAALRRRAARG